jgi:methylamine---glutamate N-methyltransferase subunit A
MCGIVGLHLKTERLEGQLGALAAGMLACMAERGPDSAGLALYGPALPEGTLRYSVRAERHGVDWERLAHDVGDALGVEASALRRAGDAVLETAGDPAQVTALLHAVEGVRLVGLGRAVEVFKDVGGPVEICERYRIAERGGTRALGHTRMATESAVTVAHSHPFVPYPDLALVHNGSFSNYASIRRDLERAGERFDTDNDSEVAARFLGRERAGGAALDDALRLLQKHFDGFYTLLVATADEFCVLRDSFACKPAVVAETATYVAAASEFRALAELPGIADADTFEPKPEEIYRWAG